MRRILFLFILSFTFPFMAFGIGFNSVTSPNGTNVIAVGNQGLVWRSSNGGTSWESYNIGSINLMSAASQGNSFWICAADGRVYKGDITSPGVLSAQTIDNTVSLNSITFIDANTGFICGSGGNIYKTVNGGNTWMSSSSGLNSQNLYGISFQNSSNGIVVGANGTVFSTTNGGSSWQSVVSGISKNLTDVKYFSDGVAAVGDAGALIIKNGASPFTSVNTNTWEDIKGVSGTNISDVHICGGGGFIRNNKSSNTSFLNFEINPMMANLVDISYSTSSIVYAVSSLNNAVIKSTNAGLNWSLTGGAAPVYNLAVAHSGGTSGIGNGFVMHPTNRNIVYNCQGTKVYRSGDQGTTWTTIATVSAGSSCHSFFVSPQDTNVMIASMDAAGGRVMRSTNYGATWTMTWGPGTLTSYGCPLEMDQNNPSVLYLGPDNNILLKSTDFGATWSNFTTKVFRSPCDIEIQYFNSNVMYIGDGITGSGFGILWKTTNGGTTWDSIRSVTGSEIPMVSTPIMDTNRVYHTAWSTGGVWRTFNKFNTFDQIGSSGSSWWTGDVSLDDPNAYAASTLGGALSLTYDGGNNFPNVGNAGGNEGTLYINKGCLLLETSNNLYKVTVSYNVSATPVVVTGIENNFSSLPERYSLYQNYPNPFNPVTTISFDLPVPGNVKLSVFNHLGQEVKTLISGFTNAGAHSIGFNGENLASGTYYYKLITPEFTSIKKMILLK